MSLWCNSCRMKACRTSVMGCKKNLRDERKTDEVIQSCKGTTRRSPVLKTLRLRLLTFLSFPKDISLKELDTGSPLCSPGSDTRLSFDPFSNIVNGHWMAGCFIDFVTDMQDCCTLSDKVLIQSQIICSCRFFSFIRKGQIAL